jgi:hypothetical protein
MKPIFPINENTDQQLIEIWNCLQCSFLIIFGEILFFGIVIIILILTMLTAHGQIAGESLTITISYQTSPYTLPKGLNLYSAETCPSSNTQRIRVISAGQIRQIAEANGISFTDPALLPSMISTYVAHTFQGRLLTGISLLATGTSLGGASLTALKTSQPNIGNAHTWAEISVVSGALGAGIPMIQKSLQSTVSAEQATITNGVNKALITNMETMYTVPLGGCSGSVMFIGAGGKGIVRGVIQ